MHNPNSDGVQAACASSEKQQPVRAVSGCACKGVGMRHNAKWDAATAQLHALLAAWHKCLLAA
jgi:hypothetical protein